MVGWSDGEKGSRRGLEERKRAGHKKGKRITGQRQLGGQVAGQGISRVWLAWSCCQRFVRMLLLFATPFLCDPALSAPFGLVLSGLVSLDLV